jgi:hypothetical protein
MTSRGVSFDLRRWGILACLEENTLDTIMEFVAEAVFRGICRDGRAVAKARERSRQDGRARKVEGAGKSWGAYVIVCDMVERAVRASVADAVFNAVEVEGEAAVLLEMFRNGFVEDVTCSVLNANLRVPPVKIDTYRNSYTHTMVFYGVIIMIESPVTSTGLITMVAHYELGWVYNIFDLTCSCGSYDNKFEQLTLCPGYSETIVQILNLRLNYAKNPLRPLSASMGKAATILIPRKPVMDAEYYEDYNEEWGDNILGEIEDNRVPLDAFVAYLQCVVGLNPEGVDTEQLANTEWNGSYLGYAVFWKDGPLFYFIERDNSVFVFRTPQLPSEAPWQFEKGFV